MNHDLFLATEEPQVTVVVGVDEIAGIEPVSAHDFGGCDRVLPVPDHFALRLDPNAADRPRRHLFPRLVANRDAVPRDGAADGAAFDDT